MDDSLSVWDLRDCRRPATSLRVVSGANQAKWAPRLRHILASAHDGDIKVWDIRVWLHSALWTSWQEEKLKKPSAPVQYLAGHLTKVIGLDWSPNEEMTFVSTSQDKSIKVPF